MHESTSTTHTGSEPLNVSQPTRSAEDNKKLVEKGDSTEEFPLLPSLEVGLTLLDIEGDRGVPILHSLVLDHLLVNDGPAFWVDANGHATTTTLARIAPSRRVLNRIHVARGFTAYQHYTAVTDLSTAIKKYPHLTESSSTDSPPEAQTPSLIVVPAVDAHYRTDDTLDKEHATTLQARTLAQLTNYATTHEIPVVLTRSTTDGFTKPVARAADHHLQCEQTTMGPRFTGEDFETLLYPTNGSYYQTTFAYWQQLLRTRAKQVGIDTPTSPTRPTTPDHNTISGDRAASPADPLAEAWHLTGGH